jgi:hypothetical protein
MNLWRRRRVFQKTLGAALGRYYGVSTVELEKGSAGKRHGFGAAYLRFNVDSHAVIAVDPEESSAVVDGLMRAAILWSSMTGRNAITVVVPALRRAIIVARLESMPRLASSFKWLQWNGDFIEPLDRSVNLLETHVEERKAASPAIEAAARRVVSLRPDLLRMFPSANGKAISIRLRGIEVCRLGDGETDAMDEGLASLIAELDQKRRYSSRHALARVYEERWLETSLIDQMDRILPSADRRHVYPQVPSFVGQERHTVDLLTITREGRLAVMEVKVGSDPDLPFQSLDYWLAVERHRKAGDFASGGYFEGVDIQDAPAILIVVAPLLSFHRTFDRLVEFLPSEAPLIQVGIADTWKRDIRVLRRKGSVE